MTTLYYNFNFEKNFQIDLTKSFIIEQPELILKDEFVDSTFKKMIVNYECSFIKQKNWNVENPTIIICIKDNEELLSFTLQNLKNFNVFKVANVIIADDRSQNENIKNLTIDYQLSYLRVDNKKGFNFSMLNNISALIAKKMGSKEIILWNSDLWCDYEEALINVLSKHRKENGVISGARLIYPPKNISFQKDSLGGAFLNKKDWHETIQFGGSKWINSFSFGSHFFLPHHFGRFAPKEDPRFNCDKGENFVTGAFQVIDLDWFIKIGGFNPSLSKNFQDTDLCLKALKDKKEIFYFGKEYFFHDESISLNKEGKNDLQLLSDYSLFSKIWGKEIEQLIF